MAGIEAKVIDPHDTLIYGLTKDQAAAPALVPGQLVAKTTGISLGRLSGEILLAGGRCEIVDPHHYLEMVKEHLEDGSVAMIFNHLPEDILPWAEFVRENFDLHHTGVLLARRYNDPHRGIKDIKGKTMYLAFSHWTDAFGGEIISLVQTKEKWRYPDADTFNFLSILKARQFLRVPGNVLAFAPEGRRMDGDHLGDVEEGIEDIIKAIKNNTLILPVAITPGQVNIKPWGDPTKIFVGRPYFKPELEQESQTHPDVPLRHVTFVRNALLVPPQNRGIYQPIIERYPELGQKAA